MLYINSAVLTLTFLALALLVALVAVLAATRNFRRGLVALNLGAAVFLGQFLGFVGLAACGLPDTLAQGAALGLGVAATLSGPAAG